MKFTCFFARFYGRTDTVGVGMTEIESVMSLMARSVTDEDDDTINGKIVVFALQGPHKIRLEDIQGNSYGVSFPSMMHECHVGDAEVNMNSYLGYVDKEDHALNLLMRYVPHKEDHCTYCHGSTGFNQLTFFEEA